MPVLGAKGAGKEGSAPKLTAQLNAALALAPAPELGGGTKGEWQHPQPVLQGHKWAGARETWSRVFHSTRKSVREEL